MSDCENTLEVYKLKSGILSRMIQTHKESSSREPISLETMVSTSLNLQGKTLEELRAIHLDLFGVEENITFFWKRFNKESQLAPIKATIATLREDIERLEVKGKMIAAMYE